MNAFLFILGYIIVICEFLWYFTCTTHEDVPLIIVLIVLFVSLIPGANLIAIITFPVLIAILTAENKLTLKRNWFNKKFLSYHE